MNPPSTPHTPLTATVPPLSSRSLDPMSPHPLTSRGNGNGKSDRRPNALQIPNDSDRRMLHNQWREPETAPLDAKRRRLNGSPFQRTNSPDTESGSISSQQQTYVSRPGVTYFRSHVDPPSNGHSHVPQQRHDSEGYYDPSLTLPPLKADGTSSTRIQTDTVMTIPVLNKIKVLAKISPPLSEQDNSQSRGIVIAVEGQDPTQVKVMLKYLGQLLMDDGKYVVRVFEGPDIVARRGSISGEMGDATVDYLNVISAWHRISDEIVQFISSPKSSPQTANGSKSSSRTGSPQSGIEILSAGSSPSPPTTVPSTTATSPSPVPIALVPRYQLTTADAFACSIPINDSYQFLDHWQWMASLWRACIGPDVTVHIRECDREEIERHGPGNPVEVRLNEARTLIVRRLPDLTKDLEEKALKRVGFEIEDFLTR
jgi:HMG box factor, other